jgi:hypothetical protein
MYDNIPDITERTNMNNQTTDKLLDVINELISLVKKNTDNINKLAHEVAKLKEVKHDQSKV